LALSLSIEMVPAPLQRHNLRSLLGKTGWQKLREQRLEQHDSRCQVCSAETSSPQVHEEWDYDLQNSLAVAKLSTLQVRCFWCHAVEHLGWFETVFCRTARDPEGAWESLVEHYCTTNRATRHEFETAHRRAYARWQRLSNLSWTIDWGEYSPYISKKRLADYFDRKGNPVRWLCVRPRQTDELALLEDFLDDLYRLSRFYGIWIGRSAKASYLPLHFEPRGEEQAAYEAHALIPNGDTSITEHERRAGAFGASVGWIGDPIGPKATRRNTVLLREGYIARELRISPSSRAGRAP
jgi:hypothetical protein